MVVSEDGMIRYQVHRDDENGNNELTPEVIGSHILAQLKETAEDQLEAKVHRTVISVPAEFNELQRNYTRKAAELAGRYKRNRDITGNQLVDQFMLQSKQFSARSREKLL